MRPERRAHLVCNVRQLCLQSLKLVGGAVLHKAKARVDKAPERGGGALTKAAKGLTSSTNVDADE